MATRVRRVEYDRAAVELDADADACYIYLREGVGSEHQGIFEGCTVIFDLDAEGEIVGVEVQY